MASLSDDDIVIRLGFGPPVMGGHAIQFFFAHFVIGKLAVARRVIARAIKIRTADDIVGFVRACAERCFNRVDKIAPHFIGEMPHEGGIAGRGTPKTHE